MRKTISMRACLGRSVAGIVLVLWLVAMAFLTLWTEESLIAKATDQKRQSIAFVEHYLESFEDIRQQDSFALALREWLSQEATALYEVDGGMFFRYYDPDTKEIVAESQLSWGRGFTDGVGIGERWSLEFDSGLDDAGQLRFLQVFLEDSDTRIGYDIYPEGNEHYPGDGTYARVTGIEEPGGGIRVQRLVLVHPDGEEELLIETSTRGSDPITVELKYLELFSALEPLLWNKLNGETYYSYSDVERHLENYRSAQGIVEELGFNAVRGTYTSCRGGEGGPELALAWDYQTRPTAMYNLRRTYLVTFALALLVIWGMTRRLTRQTAKPLEALCNQVERNRPCFSDSNLREINALADVFNGAQSKLKEDMRRQKDLTRAVAHELKTPTAVLRAYAEALREDAVPEQRQEYLLAIETESERLAVLVNELLDLSRMEGAAGNLSKETVDLAALVRAGFERLRVPMEEHELTLELELEQLTVQGDLKRLEQAVNNLAVNALRHAKPGPVRVRLIKRDGYAVLSMENRCSVLSLEVLKHIWEPFYKVDVSRSGEGSGLGLAVVRNIVALHGGGSRAEGLPDGIRFVIELPLE